MDPAPIIIMFAIIYCLKIIFLIKYITEIISILPNTIKTINDIFVRHNANFRDIYIGPLKKICFSTVIVGWANTSH